MVMGHELTHGFDNSGRQYDQYGNLKVWWNEASADAFLQRTKCIINQYNQFTVGKKNVSHYSRPDIGPILPLQLAVNHICALQYWYF